MTGFLIGLGAFTAAVIHDPAPILAGLGAAAAAWTVTAVAEIFDWLKGDTK